MPNEPTASVAPEMVESTIQPTLSLRDITKHYAAIAALTDVSFDVLPGEVHALLGENGAGKSTLMNVASGAERSPWPASRSSTSRRGRRRTSGSRSSTSTLRSSPT